MDGHLHIMTDHEPDLDTPEEREKFYQEVCIAVLQFQKYQTHPFTSWSKPERLSVKGPLLKAKWTIL